MTDDPIVNEVRKIRDQIASECNYDLHTYFEMLRNEESGPADKTSKTMSTRSSSNTASEQSRSADFPADA